MGSKGKRRRRRTRAVVAGCCAGCRAVSTAMSTWRRKGNALEVRFGFGRSRDTGSSKGGQWRRGTRAVVRGATEGTRYRQPCGSRSLVGHDVGLLGDSTTTLGGLEMKEKCGAEAGFGRSRDMGETVIPAVVVRGSDEKDEMLAAVAGCRVARGACRPRR